MFNCFKIKKRNYTNTKLIDEVTTIVMNLTSKDFDEDDRWLQEKLNFLCNGGILQDKDWIEIKNKNVSLNNLARDSYELYILCKKIENIDIKIIDILQLRYFFIERLYSLTCELLYARKKIM